MMITGNLETTNLLLGVMAAVSVLEALVLIALAIAGYRLYTTAMRTIQDLEARQVAPLRAKAEAILADVQGVTARVRAETERVDEALRGTMERVDETAEIVRSRVRAKTGQVVAIVRRLRAVIEAVLNRPSPRQPPAEATGHV
jgi:hypothetical protein